MSKEHGMLTHPEIHGPFADQVKYEPVSQPDGFAESHSEVSASDLLTDHTVEESPMDEPQNQVEEKEIDPSFPFGTPDEIKWSEIDQAGLILIKEINTRTWMKSTEYCSGHPLDRAQSEESPLYPYRTGENVYQELTRLDMAYVRGLITDVYFRDRKRELREIGSTRFYLNVNVYSLPSFQAWTQLFASMLMLITNSTANPLRVQMFPLRPGMNFSITWDYWTMEERELIHELALQSLSQFPV